MLAHLAGLCLKLCYSSIPPLTWVMASGRLWLAWIPAWQPGPAVVGCVVWHWVAAVTGAMARLGQATWMYRTWQTHVMGSALVAGFAEQCSNLCEDRNMEQIDTAMVTVTLEWLSMLRGRLLGHKAVYTAKRQQCLMLAMPKWALCKLLSQMQRFFAWKRHKDWQWGDLLPAGSTDAIWMDEHRGSVLESMRSTGATSGWALWLGHFEQNETKWSADRSHTRKLNKTTHEKNTAIKWMPLYGEMLCGLLFDQMQMLWARDES